MKIEPLLNFLKLRSNSAYRLELFDHLKFYNKAACILGAILIISGIGLDYFYYPEHLNQFAALRILTSIIVLFFGWLFEKAQSDSTKKILSYAWMYTPQFLICYIIYITNAEKSIYFFGLTLSIVGVAFLMPLSIFESLTFGATTIILYYASCFFNNSLNHNINQFWGNSIYLIFYALIGFTISIYSELRRWESFKLKRQLFINNENLEQANKSLTEIKGHMIQQEKMSALGTLSAGLLHELNNPVNYSMMAIGMAEMEPEVKTNPLLKESLLDAKEGMTRVRDIVTDLKTFAYQRPGQDNNRIFLFENALRSALRLSSFDMKHIAITQDLPLDTHVIGDEPALIGVLINLITNAALALNKSGRSDPFIKITAEHRPHVNSNSMRLFVTVTDNGTGIKPENITKVFEPFFTTRDVGQGLGLGLAVSYAIIQRHGSELRVKSLEGEWTEFSFDLASSLDARNDV